MRLSLLQKKPQQHHHPSLNDCFACIFDSQNQTYRYIGFLLGQREKEYLSIVQKQCVEHKVDLERNL